MTTSVNKIVVCITDVLLNSEEGVRYFAIPGEYKELPEKAVLVALGNTGKCWIEVFPVDSSNAEGIDDFSEDYEVVVDIDNSFLPLGTPYPEVTDWRWFALLSD